MSARELGVCRGIPPCIYVLGPTDVFTLFVGVLFGVCLGGWLVTYSGCFTFGGRARLVGGLSGQQYLFGKEKREKKKSAILMS